MTEWLREGIEGHSLKATLRLYVLGLMVLAPAAALLALVFGGHTSFVATPLLVFIVVVVEYAISYRTGPEIMKNIHRLISTDESDEAQSKRKDASKPIEPVRKRA